jgi:TPR repeat protein
VNIVGPITGLVVMIILIPSLGLMTAFILGALAGGAVGFILNSVRNRSSAPVSNLQERMVAESDTEMLTLVEIGKRLAKVKGIPVQREASYLADIVAGIEGGDAQAHWMLGDCFLSGKVHLADPFPRDKKSALFWFRRSAELGLASSQYHLGVIYLGDAAWQLGIGYSEDSALEKSFDEAIKWLSGAASQSDTFAALAQDVLGEMYFRALG